MQKIITSQQLINLFDDLSRAIYLSDGAVPDYNLEQIDETFDEIWKKSIEVHYWGSSDYDYEAAKRVFEESLIILGGLKQESDLCVDRDNEFYGLQYAFDFDENQ
ncbi:hypothetical protein AAEU29_18310 [Pseudoalteromonas sp. SSM20]|uniref:hypothetical protein n=1 Tax=Pseudoalteromonas sp. SSM20 TaxID=3139394 RepID=UPI003BAD79F6